MIMKPPPPSGDEYTWLEFDSLFTDLPNYVDRDGLLKSMVEEVKVLAVDTISKDGAETELCRHRMTCIFLHHIMIVDCDTDLYDKVSEYLGPVIIPKDVIAHILAMGK